MRLVILFTLISFCAYSQGTKISDMPSAVSLGGGELVPIVQTTNKKTTVQLIRGFAGYGSAGQYLVVNGTADGLTFATPSFVTSVFGRTGAIVAATNDYTPLQVGAWGLTGSSTITTPTIIGNPYFQGNSLFAPSSASITANTRLDVRGIASGSIIRLADEINTTRLVGLNAGAFTFTGHNASDDNFIINSSAGNFSLGLGSNGVIRFGTSANKPIITSASNTGSQTANGTSLRIESNHNSTSSRTLTVAPSSTNTQTTGAFVTMEINHGGFNPSSGTASHTNLMIDPVINQTGTASGRITGVDYDPILTSILGQHIAWRNTSGQLIFGGTTLTTGSVLADFQSTNSGVVMPRVTNRASVTTPVNGLFDYDASSNLVEFYEAGNWRNPVWLDKSQSLTNKTVNGVTLTTAGSSTQYLNATGTYTTVPGGGGTYIAPSTIAANSTNADFTAVVNTVKKLPNGVLTANRTITIPSGTSGDIIEIYNRETGFTWSLTGSAVYLSDEVTTVTTLLANTYYSMIFLDGKWQIKN